VKIHQKYINRCIDLAKKGLGTSYPNPLVGSVIVCDDKIIGEGWHRKAGEAHAEVNAINSVKDKSLLKNSTIYVSLEPCSHFGKTPPCADLIVKEKIPRVVVGSIDPNSLVHGNGIKHLKDNGCKVIIGILENECNLLNKRFFTFQNKKRPYIILKWAETKDGYIDVKRSVVNLKEAKPNWITNSISRQLVHKWRAEEQSILVGTNTAVNDNPTLNARSFVGNNPIRIVIDRSLRIPFNYHVYDGEIKTIILTANNANNEIKHPESGNLIYENLNFDINLPQQICNVLFKYQIQSVLIEGGLKTLQSFIDANLWDEARVFKGDVYFKKGVKAPILKKDYATENKFLNDTLYIIKNQND